MTIDCIVKPAGLRAPPKQRSVVQEDSCSKEISGLFEKYLKQVESEDWDDSYLLAEGMVRGLDLSDQCCIDAFIISHQDDAVVTDWKTGLFVSALYNCLRQDVISYDHDLPISHLAFRLSESKRLVVNGSAGDYCGWGSSGLVLVSGSAGDWCGYNSSGLVLVSGSAGDGCGRFSSGLVLVSGTAGDYCGSYSSGLVLVSGTTGVNCGWGSSGVVVEMQEGCVKGLGPNSNGLLIPYAELVKNKELHNYVNQFITSFTGDNLSLGEQKLESQYFKSAMSEIKRLYP